jgi:hypothetical protein
MTKSVKEDAISETEPTHRAHFRQKKISPNQKAHPTRTLSFWVYDTQGVADRSDHVRSGKGAQLRGGTRLPAGILFEFVPVHRVLVMVSSQLS